MRAVISHLDLTEIEDRRFAVPPAPDERSHITVLDSLAAWAVEVATRHDLRILSAEIGSQGSLNRATGEVFRSTLGGWGHFNLANELRAALARRCDDAVRVAIHVDRDTNSSMLARIRLLAGDTATLDLSPDGPTAYFGGRYALSGGLYDGRIVRGALGLAGDYGHMVVDPGGRLCWCGRTGCLETKVGLGPLYERRFGRAVPVQALSAEGPRLIHEICMARDAKDPEMLKLLADAGDWIARSVQAISAVANPARIIIDGYLAQLGDPIVATAVEQITIDRGYPPLRRLEVVAADGDPSMPMQGALIAALFTVARFPSLAATNINPGETKESGSTTSRPSTKGTQT